MAEPLSPLAMFDALSIVRGLLRHLPDVAHDEVHLFSYLACLLHLYNGKPVSRWGYKFAATEAGSPFAAELQGALRTAIAQGHLVEGDDGFLRASDLLDPVLALMEPLQIFASRRPCIDGAVAALLALPVGTVRSALSRQRELGAAQRLGISRTLLEEAGVKVLHEEFNALASAIGPSDGDLMVPAVVWLSFLAESRTTGGGKATDAPSD